MTKPAVFPAFAVILIAASLQPFALAAAGFMPERLFFYLLFPLLVLWVTLRGRVPLLEPFLGILGLQILTFVWLALYHDDVAHALTAATLGCVAIVYVALRSGLVRLDALVRAYVYFILAILLLADVSSVLAFTGQVEPVFLYDRGDGGVYRVGLTLSSEWYRRGEGYFIRPGGVFAEPGQLGMHVVLALLANVVVLGDRRLERMLLVLALGVTSLGVYFSMFVFLLLWRRKVEIIAGLGMLAGIVLIAGGLEVLREDLIANLTLNRALDAIGSEAGGNRLSDSLAALGLISEAGLWGLPVRRWELIGGDLDATFFGPFLLYGLAGGTIVFLHVLFFGMTGAFLSWRYKANSSRNDLFKAFVLLALSLYHRPFVVHFLYYVLLLSMYLGASDKLAAFAAGLQAFGRRENPERPGPALAGASVLDRLG